MGYGYTRNYTAGGAIAKNRIVKFSSSDGVVVQAAAAADAQVGVAELEAASGERVDVQHSGPVDVEFGGTVARGAPFTADADGKAVAPSPSAGSNVRIMGFALFTAAAGDIGPAILAPGLMQG